MHSHFASAFTRNDVRRLRFTLVCCCALSIMLTGGCGRGNGRPDGSGNRDDNQNAGATLDSDNDGLVNAEDNCPDTPNADQADGDGNGVGDACETPFLDDVTAVTDEGVVEARLDERRRPTLLVGPFVEASFEWADDSTAANVRSSQGEESLNFSIAPEFSDDALRAALDELANETGADVSLTRDWIDAHPGTVGEIVSGAQTLRTRTPPAAATDPTRKDSSALISQAVNPAVEEYILGLQVAFFVVLGTADSLGNLWQEQNRDPDIAHPLWALFWSMVRLEWYMQDLVESQAGFCETECTLSCQVDCTVPGTGACCTLEDDVPCLDTDEPSCAARSGTYWAGFTCADLVCPCEEGACVSGEWGACVYQVGAVSTCGQAARFTCEGVGQFYPATPCSHLESPDGACVYTTPEGRIHCADLEPEQCSLFPHSEYQAGIYCASGACYYFIDEFVIGCAYLSRVDCENLYVRGEAQITDFHAGELCVGPAR